MNVLCVKINSGKAAAPIKIKVGEIYKVVDVKSFLAYDFYELSHDLGRHYNTNQFVPIDPTEEDIREFEEAQVEELV